MNPRPYVDARLADGSRVNIIIPPVALDGPMISIRKAKLQAMRASDFVTNNSMTREMVSFPRQRHPLPPQHPGLRGHRFGCKTTLMNMLSGFIPDGERLVTIEGCGGNCGCAPAMSFGSKPGRRRPRVGKEVNARDLVRNALRMRPRSHHPG